MTIVEEAKYLLSHTFHKENNSEYWTLDGKYDGEYKSWYSNGEICMECFLMKMDINY